MKESVKEILASNTEEKTGAIEAIWDSIVNDSLAIIDEEVQIEKHRCEEYPQNPGDVINWNEARQKLMLRYVF